MSDTTEKPNEAVMTAPKEQPKVTPKVADKSTKDKDGTGAVVNPGDEGYKAQVAPDVGGFVNIAESDKDFAAHAVEDDTLPQQTLDEIEAGKAALERRNGGRKRKLDDADVADIRNADRAAGKE